MAPKTAFPIFYSGNFTTFAYPDGSLTMHDSRFNPERQFPGFKFPTYNGEGYVARAVSFEVVRNPRSGGFQIFKAEPTGDEHLFTNLDLANLLAKDTGGAIVNCTIHSIVGNKLTCVGAGGGLGTMSIEGFPDKGLLAKNVASQVVCVVRQNVLVGIATEDGKFAAETFPG